LREKRELFKRESEALQWENERIREESINFNQ